MIECTKGLCFAFVLASLTALGVAALAQLQGRHIDALSLLIVGVALGIVAAVGFTITARAEARQ